MPDMRRRYEIWTVYRFRGYPVYFGALEFMGRKNSATIKQAATVSILEQGEYRMFFCAS